MHKVVILHGWGQNKELWQDIINKFQAEDVIAIDLPGFGKEPLADPEWGIPEYADWVKNKIEQLNTQDVILLGHSFGGRISSFIASENPNWLKGLILYGAPCIYRPSNQVKNKIRIYKLLKKLGLKRKSNNSELNSADKQGLGKIFRKVVNFDQTQILPKINAPTLLVWGENDTEVPVRIAKEINSLINNSKLVILQNSDHNVHLENPNIFYGTIKTFIDSI